MSAKSILWVALGAVLGLMTLVLVVVLPSVDNPCEGSSVLGSNTVLPTFGGPVIGAPMPAAAANPSATQSIPAVTGTPSLAAGAGPVRRTLPIEAGKFTVSDVFGARGGTHLGVDLAAPDGTTIYSVADGKVVAAGPASGFGNWIVIDSIDFNGRTFSAVYGHMWDSGIHVRVGDTVTAGQPIAQVGSAGESSGPHLHFEIVPGGRFTGGRQIDPIPWLDGAPTPDVGGAKAFSIDPNCVLGFGTAGGALAPGKVPPELEIWYRRAGSICPEITPSLLAAQGRQESGFQRGLTSPAGAVGLAQFLPGTAAAIDPEDGKPYVIDTGGKGYASLSDDGDSIIGQGRYMCAIAHQIERWMGEGKVQGDVVALTLAAYNAGEGAVLASGGMPNQVAAHYSETRPYVANILAMEPQYRAQGSLGRFEPQPGGGSGQIVEAARQWLGTPYVWGGGGPQGPSGGGMDGPGLTSAAVFAASSGAVTLPRTAEQQWEAGVEVPLSKAQPGDLVFSSFGVRGPAQVGIYSGPGTMIVSAPTSGGVVEAAVPGDARVRRVM
ncbi:peptidoglycan DD-metalloendopeptidase family protein [Nocardia arthritidis]|uniref:Peptidoglycan DD-metalloendopeptidase family protein n=1 Tax=Nocardia arthritidis TaxID=228602 RepID=A0A6G9YKN3_9NOCA|nr:peptidoglycan DD-metalloendopeptidase family protein [Nocardia arthritidis]QIS13493.1 peptidoglycan DD-metalloendopeptidase family protein [Nocardia arthritidis]